MLDVLSVISSGSKVFFSTCGEQSQQSRTTSPLVRRSEPVRRSESEDGSEVEPHQSPAARASLAIPYRSMLFTNGRIGK